MAEDTSENENQQCELILAFAKIACAGSQCLAIPATGPKHWKELPCVLCDETDNPRRDSNVYWNIKDTGDDWTNAIAAMLAITKESRFQKSPKSRITMAMAIGRLFNHISDVTYLNLEVCDLGQWLLGSMSRSLRELKLAAT